MHVDYVTAVRGETMAKAQTPLLRFVVVQKL